MAVVPLALLGLLGLVFAAVVVLIVVAAVEAQKRAAERRQGLAAIAHQREWEYRAEDPGLVDRFAGGPFGRGHGRRASNVLLGRYDGRPFTAFDYTFTTGSGDDRRQHAYSVVALNLGVRAPDLAVGPTSTLRRWVDSLTGRDIEIGDPEFDHHFTVHSPSPEFAADVLLSEVRDVMRHHPQVSWRIAGDSLLVIRAGTHTPAEVDAKLHMMDALLDRVPSPVWDRLRGEQPR
ncbi:hypothetical protein [Nocardioides humi]|uniref:Secreted protein n=1 Tax=Nocardioides humi TaxID=449461 RepID=A0ABN2BBZ4_9ACTN|nr:hypothetical protein [Nocardioides humi]